VGLYGSLDDAPATVFANSGIGMRPYAPHNLAAAIIDPPYGDIQLQWERRSRVGWPALNPPPLAEQSELYEVKILNVVGFPLRTISSTTPEVIYSEAEQIEDFGTLVTSLRWSVAQVSATFGPGPAEELDGPV